MTKTNEPGIISLSYFYDQLERHDWFCEMSDDYRVTLRGEANWTRLKDLAKTDKHVELMRAWTKYHYSREPWGTVKAPKPRRPGAEENQNDPKL